MWILSGNNILPQLIPDQWYYAGTNSPSLVMYTRSRYNTPVLILIQEGLR
jgi:hypothetical protein